jgi:DNA-binding LytR/AlgR family response regulator
VTSPTTIIAEDEPLLRGALREALAKLWPELEILAEAEDGIQAIHALHTHQPDILFLDIEMPGLNGLDVARAASGRCHVVFVTAYNEHAVAAFEQGAVDYVMKPFSTARLAAAVGRLRDRLHSRPARLDGLIETIARPAPSKKYLQWLNVSQGANVRLITIDEVCYFQADNKYTTVITADSSALIKKAIKDLLEELDPEVFWQIHRGTVVNARAIATVHRGLRGRLDVRLKQRKETLPVSAPYAYRFRQM